ncbi:MAG: hypothetical protein ABSD59_07855 [Terracidiphilus sp.]|jgi:hypothetical protein
MFANSNRLLALVLWAAVVLALVYWKWWPRPLDLKDLGPNELAFIVPLPENGILARMIDRGAMVSLTMPEQPKPPAPQVAVKKPVPPAQADATGPKNKENPPSAAAPVAQPTPSTAIVEHARVLGKVCKVEIQSTTRVAVCYAVIAVPEDSLAALAFAADKDKVSVWVEGK